ncbi:hypothetical protein ACFVY0_40440 [Streptomyces sp. NPDC058286]|uniref:hypothetical protein n=1 Tax=Streptomyces sp. NPDC058286 TaxID=3346422 RepID=UPI0036EE2BA8
MTQTRAAKHPPTDETDPVFSGDYDEGDNAPRFDIPDDRIIGTVYKMSVQTDALGAVIVAYSRDAETGRIGRSFLRFDLAGAEYVRRRLDTL